MELPVKNLLEVTGLYHVAGDYYSAELPNYHDGLKVSFVLEGSRVLCCGLDRILLEPGQMYCIAPGTLHMAQYHEHVQTLNLRLPLSAWETLQAPDNARYLCASAKEYLPALREMLKLAERQRETAWYPVYLQQLVSLCSAAASEILFAKKDAFCCFDQPQLARDVFDYIHHHSHEDIQIPQLAEHFYVSPSHLSRIFRQYAQTSPLDATIRRRIIRASLRLLRTDDHIADIAEWCGYSNVVAFSKAFNKRNHCSPTEFRNRYRQQERTEKEQYIWWNKENTYPVSR